MKQSLRPDAITHNSDGTVTVRGSGWFWARIDRSGNVLEVPPGATKKPSWRGWLGAAKDAAARKFEAAE